MVEQPKVSLVVEGDRLVTRVGGKSLSIVGEAVSVPDRLSQFALWVTEAGLRDATLAEIESPRLGKHVGFVEVAAPKLAAALREIQLGDL